MASAQLVNKTICIARLRSKVQYKGPLNHIVDSQCYLIDNFIKKHPENKYSFYNISFDGSKPTKNLDAISDSEVIVIPSEAEWTYHIPGYIHTLDLKRSNEEMAKISSLLYGKKLVFLRSDRADNEELYRKTFPYADFKYAEIDECDFDMNIHGLKYYFIKEELSRSIVTDDSRPIDFIYWGGDKKKLPGGVKSEDERHLILKQISKQQEIKSRWIGRFANIKRDFKFMKMKDLIPHLTQSKLTLCFNWLDNKATTSRYIEAMATGIIPLVWKDYDSTNTYGIEDWQRVDSYEAMHDKLRAFHSLQPPTFQEYFQRIERNFLAKLPKKEYYENTFENKLLKELE